ncbi:MAG: low molecular weight phosphatase family protein [Phycisphaera sp.]|nr:low molecular weight phosphatase family protein [Phycisphaera sp.]
MRTVLFLCTGNYYRSRFAEALFNHIAPGSVPNWRADSRGLAIEKGVNNFGHMSKDTAQALTERHIPLDPYQRLPLPTTPGSLADADLVIALKETEHRPLLAERFPGWEERVEYWHVHDVDGSTPQEAITQIEELVSKLVQRLAKT